VRATDFVAGTVARFDANIVATGVLKVADASRRPAGIGDGWHKQYLAMLAWGILLASTLVLASLLQAVAATVLVVPETALPAAHLYEIQATLPVEALYATPESCSVPATDDKACIS
jgi:hypothetical protein